MTFGKEKKEEAKNFSSSNRGFFRPETDYHLAIRVVSSYYWAIRHYL